MTSETSTPAIDADALAKHAEWLAGGSGGVRLVLRDVTLVGSAAGADLRRAVFERVEAAGVSFDGARLDGARLSHVGFVRADLRHVSLADAHFADCDLRRAMVAGMRLARTGFLRCAFGDFAAQPIGKPDVAAAYVLASPDVSHGGDRSRVGHPGEIDARWFTPPSSGPTRRFTFEGAGHRYVAEVLHTHVQWSREAAQRFRDRTDFQGFSAFLADGAPAPYCDSLPGELGERLRHSVATLAANVVTEPAIAD